MNENHQQNENTVESYLSESKKKEILKARARMLTLKPEEPEVSIEKLNIIEFRLGTETYGLEAKYIREALPVPSLTPLPGVPAFVTGIISLRGEIISVLNLKVFFDIPGKNLGKDEKVIILASDEMEFGIMVDSIKGEKLIKLADVKTDIPTLTGVRAEYSLGVSVDRTIILNGQKILNDKTIVINEEV